MCKKCENKARACKKSFQKTVSGKAGTPSFYRVNAKTAGVLILLVVFGLIYSSCSSESAENGNGKITVYASFFTMYDFASKIGGDKVNVVNMVPSGMEPHDWEPSPRDIAGLSRADLFVYSGAGMEGWVDKILSAVDSDRLVAVETSKGITLEKSVSDGHDGENSASETGHSDEALEYDPHVWLNPENAKIQMKAIMDVLVRIDSENSSYYMNNYDYYAKKLDELDKKYRETTGAFSRKVIVVSHAAYGYLCSAYGLEQFSLEGIAGDSEPTAAKMKEIINFVKDHDVKVIFYDGISSSKVVDAVARETGARVAVLSPLEGISDEDIKTGKDYFSIMEENLKALSDALQ